MNYLNENQTKKQRAIFNRAIKENNISLLQEQIDLYPDLMEEKIIIKHLMNTLNNDNAELFKTLLKCHLHFNINYELIPAIVKKTDTIYAQYFLDMFEERCFHEGVTPELKEDVERDRKNLNNEMIFHAISSGNMNLVQFCVQNGATIYDPNFENNCLEHCALHNQQELFDYFLSLGAPLEGTNDLCLWNAFLNKNFDLFFHILDCYNPLNQTMMTSLFDNPAYPSNRIINKNNFNSIAHRFIPYLINDETKTALLISAILYKSPIIAKELLETSMNLHLQNGICLKTAAENKNGQMVKLLMDYGANPDLIIEYKFQYESNIMQILTTYPRFSAIRNKLQENLEVKSTISQHKI